MDAIVVKQEIQNPPYSVKQEIENPPSSHLPKPQPITYSISSDSSDSDFTDSEDDATTTGKRTRFSGDDDDSNKKQKVALPLGFLDPLPQEPILQLPSPRPLSSSPSSSSIVVRKGGGSKQFWKAGDYEDDSAAVNNVGGSSNYSSVGMDHVRVHPKFLHSNATSHKWALGAIAELLDNALDEVCYGATFVNIDVLENNKDVGKMLLVEDNGGGMDPDRMRQCMSLGYSAKSKLANVIGQYGNGFKTSTMRLGADVIVFSRCCRDDKAPTQSIGLLSYTFLKSTGKEDIVVPMLDFEKGAKGWNKLVRSSPDDWNRNADTIVQWSPYTSEAELFDQFNRLGDHGTRIIIYNLWEDDQGELELDFHAEPHDIQIRGANRDEDNIKKAEQFPNSRHFLTYRHSLRSYAAILYLRLPPGFRMILRGKDIEHHNIVNDMMLTQQHTYRPTQSAAGGAPKDPNMFAQVTVGFVKDAQHHIAVQGFNVYHKNRLIKPFWRVWNAAGSGGRGVIGVLEANFVEPAHDKQGFERTTVLQRLEQRLHHMQKSYWNSQSHAIGYVNRHSVKNSNASATRQSSPDYSPHQSRQPNKSSPAPQKPIQQNTPQLSRSSTRNSDNDEASQDHAADENVEHVQTRSHVDVVNGSGKVDAHASDTNSLYLNHLTDTFARDLELERKKREKLEAQLEVKAAENSSSDSDRSNLIQLRLENEELKERLTKLEESFLLDLQSERDRCSSLEAQLKESEQKMEQMNKEQDDLIDIFSEERNRRNNEEANLRKRLTDASSTIDNLLDRVRYLEKMKSVKQEH